MTTRPARSITRQRVLLFTRYGWPVITVLAIQFLILNVTPLRRTPEWFVFAAFITCDLYLCASQYLIYRHNRKFKAEIDQLRRNLEKTMEEPTPGTNVPPAAKQ